MKQYNQPETNVLQVVNSSIICASAEPTPAGQLGSVKKTDYTW